MNVAVVVRSLFRPKFQVLNFLQAQHLVQIGADITARDKQRLSALHFAAAHGHLELVSFLWSKGAELDWESPGEFPDSCRLDQPQL